MNKAVFLDRDGVINQLLFYPEEAILDSPFSPRQFKMLPGVAQAIKRLNQAGLKVIIASNQPAVAKGKMSLRALEAIDQKMKRLLAKEGAFLDEIVYCLHHPQQGKKKYRQSCFCRKPHPGLILKAARKHNIDLKQSFMVGDNLSDIQAGRAAGTKTLFIGGFKCDLCRLMDKNKARPNFITSNLKEAVDIILTGKEHKK